MSLPDFNTYRAMVEFVDSFGAGHSGAEFEYRGSPALVVTVRDEAEIPVVRALLDAFRDDRASGDMILAAVRAALVLALKPEDAPQSSDVVQQLVQAVRDAYRYICVYEDDVHDEDNNKITATLRAALTAAGASTPDRR